MSISRKLLFFLSGMIVISAAGAENLLINPTWNGQPPRPWRGEIKVQDGVASVQGNPNEIKSLWQPFKNAEPGQNYRMSAEVRGSADSEFRFCAYWPAKVNGKNQNQCSDNWRWLKGNGQWQKVETTFRFPVTAQRCPYVSLTVRKGKVEIRNWMLKKLPPPEIPTVLLGGTWRLHEKSRVGSDPDEPGNKYPEIPEISIHKPGAVLNRISAVLKPGRKYRLEFEVIGRGDSGTGTGFHGYRLEFLDSNGKSLYRVPWQDVWNTSWQKKSVRLDFLPLTDVHFSLRLFAQGGGYVAFRNFKLCEFQPDPFEKYEIVLTSPGYRNAVFATQPISRITGYVKADPRMKSGIIRLMAGEKELDRSSFCADGSFSIPRVPVQPGNYWLQAELQDHQGKLLTSLKTSLFRYARAPHEFIQGEKRNFFFDGKPMLPILFMAVPGDEDCIKAGAAAGFTGYLALSGSEHSAWNLLEQARRCSQKLVLGVRYCEDGNLDGWKKRVGKMLSPRVLAHESLLGYFLADEPLWVGANLKWLTASCEFLRRHDPFHPVWINSAPLSTIEENRPYCRAADINGIDIYPIPYPSAHSSLPDKYPTAVGKYARSMYETTDGRKSIWMVLQGTSWGSLGIKRKGDYPSLMELRFMMYDALFNTANGIVFWGTKRAKDKQFFRDLRTAVYEVSRLTPLLLHGQRAVLPAPDGMVIHQISCNGKKYYLAMNNTPQKVKARMKIGFPDIEVPVLFENRKIRSRDEIITDEFSPFSCHWYSAAPLPPAEVLPGYTFAEDPFDRLCRQRNSPKQKFTSRAFWIWDRSSAQKQGNTARLRKKFTVKKLPKQAKFLVAVDNYCKITFNGKFAGSHSAWDTVKTLDVLPLLKVGENMLEVQVSDSGHLPCGFLAELHLDGKTELISDETWDGAPDSDGEYTKVKVLAPYGKGDWGNRVRLDVK